MYAHIYSGNTGKGLVLRTLPFGEQTSIASVGFSSDVTSNQHFIPRYRRHQLVRTRSAQHDI